MISTKQRNPKTPGTYKVQVMQGFGANASMREDFVEWRALPGSPPEWQTPHGTAVEYWQERK